MERILQPMKPTVIYRIAALLLVLLGAVTAYNQGDFIIMGFFIFGAAVGIIVIIVQVIERSRIKL